MYVTQSCDSPPQKLPLGIPIEIAIIEKNRKRAWDDGKREKSWPARPRALFFFLPSLPTSQRGLCGGERTCDKRGSSSA